jgi:hypothetical protein
MRANNTALVALVASAFGIVFAAYSYDYAQQLDRQVP